MSVENKHGRYDKFDINKARWDCPSCGEDAMMLETRAFRSPYKFVITHSFKCEKCGINTLDYNFSMKKKCSFNASHRKFTEIWPYLLTAQRKGWIEGFDAGVKLSNKVQR